MSIIRSRTYIRNKPYRLPNPLNSLEDALRFENMDLQYMDTGELCKEEIKLQNVLANLDSDKPSIIPVSPWEFIATEEWVLRRKAAIRKELQRRGG